MNKFLAFCYRGQILEESLEWVEEYKFGEQPIETNLLMEAAVGGLRDQLL